MNQLVKIKPAPPLSQSLVKTLACARSYRAIVIDGLKPPPSGPTDRGDEVHYVAAAYTDHCVSNQVAGDWVAFDRIAALTGAEAFAILEGVRDNYVVDFDHVVGTEIWFCLDENFRPVRVPDGSQDWSREQKEQWAAANGVAYSGTIDIGLLMGNQGGIDDWKSSIRPFDAPDEQSDMYSVAWMQLHPHLESVLFRFRFVRYGHCERTAEYTREDLPRLMTALEHWRAKQLAIHANPGDAEAIPSKQCLYCPLLNNGCPIPEQVNPYASPTLQERLRLAVYFSYANKHNNDILKEYVQAAGTSLRYTDGKGDAYEFGKKETEGQVFPLLPTMAALMEHRNMVPDDIGWFDNLRVGATKLKGYLKAKKRAPLHQFIMDTVAKPETKVKFGLHKAGDDPEDEEGEYRGE